MEILQNSAVIAAQKILAAIANNRKSDSSRFFLSDVERNAIWRIWMEIKCEMNWSFNFKDFFKILCKYQNPPMEFLWNIHMLQIMPFENYILNISCQARALVEFKENVCALCFLKSDENSYSFFVQSGILSYLINKAYPFEYITEVEVKLVEICAPIIREILQGIFYLDEKDIANERLRLVFTLWDCATLEKITLSAFCTSALWLFLEQEPASSALDAFSIQENCKSKAAPFHLQIVIEKFTATLETEAMGLLIYTAIRKRDTNRKHLIEVVDSFIQTHDQGPVTLSKFVIGLIKEAFEHMDENSLLNAILIGRQISLRPDVSFHVAYGQWFQAHFEECISLKNPEVFLFFIQVMSDLMPFEKNIDCIKVALERTLYVPPTCQIVYADYIALLKTRMKDLKPQVHPEKTLEKILLLYQETGKIPPVVLEASLMQKHHFLNEFLPSLLSPRVVPKIPDTKERFIEALNQAGKIPSQILQKYRNGCLQEEERLLAGINMTEDNFNDVIEEDIS